MKKHLFILSLSLALTTGSVFNASPIFAEDAPASGTITAYYFHGNFRCPTCRKLEQYSQEALSTHFKASLDSGKIAFKTVNMEDKGNEHYVNDYQLYTKSLVLSLTKDGKEVRSKNLDKIWEYVGNKQRFQDYIRDEVAAFMKEA